ncbi:MAG: polyribonucleotide nucleotidyltransferase [Actinobacteria bacterium]|nr:polyribonucleotide nucleotidyltransferase [Actinomycetota bacterium]
MEIVSKEIEISGRKIRIETGKFAKQADGAALVSCDGTSVLVTVVAAEDVRQTDFLPLTVDVEERMYAAGKIPGSFFRREGRPTEVATLTARIIDRTIRPNFEKELRNELQVVLTVLSTDQVNPPDMLGIVGASAAITLSNIPFHGPLAGVRVGRLGDDWKINPTYQELEDSTMNLIVAGNRESLIMVEAGARQVTEGEIVEGLEVGQKAIKEIIEVIDRLDEEVRRGRGEKPKNEIIGEISSFLEPRYGEAVAAFINAYKGEDANEIDEKSEAFKQVAVDAAGAFPASERKIVGILSRIIGNTQLIEALSAEMGPGAREEMTQALLDASREDLSKSERSLKRKDTRKALGEAYMQKFSGLESEVKQVLDDLEAKLLRRQMLEDSLRPDGRKPFQIRKITCEVGLLPKTHGSALFTRGETQVLTIATLGAHGEKQILDDLGIEEYKRFIHHYNFPPYSSGEARPMRGPKRRDIGHGALAERALLPVVPVEDEFPYTIRLVSEVLESNGSTSMASTCASSMALMDAGVPLTEKSAVSGIAMGLVIEDGRHVFLSDIQGLEDAIGDMDFKVAGTKLGITALQMDIKCLGISQQIMEEALEQARQGRYFIIKAMSDAIAEPRTEVSPNAPRMMQMKIPVDKIGDLIGPGGRNIRGLIERYDVEIDVENDGSVFVFGRDRDNVESVKREIERIARDPEVGDKYLGTVVKTTNFGAFVQLAPGKDGLIHISKLSDKRVDRVEDVVNVGDKVEVEIEGIDNLGRIDLRPIDLAPGKS